VPKFCIDTVAARAREKALFIQSKNTASIGSTDFDIIGHGRV
jgi:hypothetical protein